MWLLKCSPVLFTLLVASLPAQASDFYPITTGRSWTYGASVGAPSSAIVDAAVMFAGTLCQPLHWNSGTRENYSQDGEGRVFHHGTSGALDGSYRVFNPPMLWMDSELSLDHEWVTDFDNILYNAAGIELQRVTVRITCRVIGFASVTVPAGTFDAVEVRITHEQSPAPAYTFRNMYAAGVGYIRRTDAAGNILFQLTSYGGIENATESTTWGAVKARYK